MNRILLLCTALSLFATKAKCDKIIFKGDTLTINAKSLLDKYPRIKSLHSKLINYKALCYDAEWTILNNGLYLTNIYSCAESKTRSKENINSLFHVSDGKVKASWVTGDFWIPVGQPIHYHHVPLYKAETHITIVNGKVISLQKFNYINSRESIYNSDHNALSKFIYKHINWNKIPNLKDQMIQVAFRVETGNSGKPENIKKQLLNGGPNGAYNKSLYDGEAKKVIGMLPWSVYYRHGKVYKDDFVISVYFMEKFRQLSN